MEGALVELSDERLTQAVVGKPLREVPGAKPFADVLPERRRGVEDVAEDRHAAVDEDGPEIECPRCEEKQSARCRGEMAFKSHGASR